VIFTAHDDTPIEVGGFGVSLDEFRAIADELETAQRSIFLFYGRATSAVTRDMDPLVQTPVPVGGLDVFGLLSQPVSGVLYVGREGGARLGVQLDEPSSKDDLVWSFLVPSVHHVVMSDVAKFTSLAGGRAQFPIGTDPDVPHSLLFRWSMGDRVVTATSIGLSPTVALDALGSARLPGQSEWAGMVQNAVDGQLGGDAGGDDPGTRTLVGRSQAGSTDPPWRIEMSDSPMSVFASAGASGWGGRIGAVARLPALHQFASSTMTYVVGTAPTSTPARTMRVTVTGRDPVDVALVRVGGSEVLAGGFAYSTLADASIEFLDDAGNVVG
jgi:hypothetical protein